MPYEIIPFRDADAVLRQKQMDAYLEETLRYLDTVLYGRYFRGSQLKTCLDEMGWKDGNLAILEGRRYQFKGLFKRVGIEANLYVYEWILEGLFRLQLGYDKGLIDAGILLLSGRRSPKSPLGTTKELVQEELEAVYPTVSLPVMVALFDLGVPQCIEA